MPPPARSHPACRANLGLALGRAPSSCVAGRALGCGRRGMRPSTAPFWPPRRARSPCPASRHLLRAQGQPARPAVRLRLPWTPTRRPSWRPRRATPCWCENWGRIGADGIALSRLGRLYGAPPAQVRHATPLPRPGSRHPPPHSSTHPVSSGLCPHPGRLCGHLPQPGVRPGWPHCPRGCGGRVRRCVGCRRLRRRCRRGGAGRLGPCVHA